MFSIHYRRKNHGSANMSWMYVVLQKSRICILLISWMKSGRSFVIWRAPVWISSLLGALNGWPPWSFYMPLLKDRVEELGPQNESVRSFPRGKAELLYAVFVKSSWLLWRRTKKQQEHKPILLQRSIPENPQKVKESMVLILSTSAIIGAKTSAVPHFLTGLPFWIVASGNIGTMVENRQLLKDGIRLQMKYRFNTWKCCIFSLVSIHSY